MAELAYINGKFVKMEKAVVSIDDRGYYFGDGIYEVFRTYDRKIFAFKEHMARLGRSTSAIGLKLPITGNEIRRIIERGIKLCPGYEVSIYLQVTRGIGPRLHEGHPGMKPNLLLTFGRLKTPDDETRKGVKLITARDTRWKRCDVKSINLLANVLAKMEAKKKGAKEAILVGDDGVVTEGSASNVFIVDSKRRVYTHPLNERILGGVTRDLLIKQARKNGIRIIERPFKLGDLRKASEVFITATSLEVLAAKYVDGKRVKGECPGEMTLKLHSIFRKYVEDSLAP
jgi:D-alanine transaminase